MKKLNFRCSGCGRSFKTSQALGNHVNYCRRLKERPVQTVQATPAIPTAPRPIPSVKVSQGKWDPNWGDILESIGFEWGIAKGRNERWKVVALPGTGMTYGEALIAADRRNSISRIMPPVRHVPTREEDEEVLALGLVLLELMMSHRA